MPLIVKVIAHTQFHGVPSDLLPLSTHEQDGAPTPIDAVHNAWQDHGTDAERLVECAGRACYDSYGRGRKSSDYHQHIMDVDHGSVTEHVSLTFFLSGISRGLTHELVRHRVGVAISQRSTRYVDESESAWVPHPLEDLYLDTESPGGNHLMSLEGCVMMAKDKYKEVVGNLEAWLTGRGVDKLTARKQARGVARGYLGNALMTEMVWTCNLRALKQILKQRANQHADAEIRVLANRLYEEALPYWPTYLGCYHKRPCPDGIGYELYIPDPRDAEIARLKAELSAQKT